MFQYIIEGHDINTDKYIQCDKSNDLAIAVKKATELSELTKSKNVSIKDINGIVTVIDYIRINDTKQNVFWMDAVALAKEKAYLTSKEKNSELSNLDTPEDEHDERVKERFITDGNKEKEAWNDKEVSENKELLEDDNIPLPDKKELPDYEDDYEDDYER